MAITTQGHRLSNLARFTPADPSLVAFTPAPAVSGIMDVLRVGATLDKIRADRAAQEELAALRPTRISSTIAQDKLLEAIASGRLPNVPAQLSAEAADIVAKKAEAEARVTQAGETREISPYKVRAEKARLGSIAEIAPFTTEAQIAAAKRGAKRDVRGVGIDPIMEDLALSDAYYGTRAKSLAPELTLANIGALGAKARLDEANAEFIAGGGRTQDRAIQELAAINLDIKRSSEQFVANPMSPGTQMTLAAYESEFGHPDRPTADDRWLKWTGLRSDLKRNPQADEMLRQLDQKAAIAADITKKLAQKRGIGGEEDVTPQVRAGAKKMTADDLANKWLNK